MFTFVVETYDHSSGEEEEQPFVDPEEAATEFVRLAGLMSDSFSVTLRREVD